MSEISYFIRWKGAVSGPFSPEQIRQALKNGSVSRHSQYSADQRSWDSISKLDAILEDEQNSATLRKQQDENAKRDQLRLAKRSDEGEVSKEKHIQSERNDSDKNLWYYHVGGDPCGPLGLDQIGKMIEQKKLPVTTQICPQGGKEWQSAQSALGISVPTDNTPFGLPFRSGPAPQYVPNHMVLAVMSLLFFLPFGIVAIVYASQVDGRCQCGDLRGAMDSSRKASSWGWWAIALPFLSFAILFLIGFFSAL